MNNAFAEWDDPHGRRANPGGPTARTPTSSASSSPCSTVSQPAGTYFWRTCGELYLMERDLRTDRRWLADPDGAAAAGCAFRADESRVCVAFGHRAVVWRLDDAEAPPLKLRGHKATGACGRLPAWRRDSVHCRNGRQPCGSGTRTPGRSSGRSTGASARCDNAAVSPDGTLCAAGGEDGAHRSSGMWICEVLKCSSGKRTKGKIESAAFSADGQLLATANRRHPRAVPVGADHRGSSSASSTGHRDGKVGRLRPGRPRCSPPAPVRSVTVWRTDTWGLDQRTAHEIRLLN